MPLLSPAIKISSFLVRVEANVYPRGCKSYCFKHTAEWGKIKAGRSIIGQYMEIWFFKHLCSNGISHTD